MTTFCVAFYESYLSKSTVVTKDILASVQETYMHLWAKTKFGMQFAYDQYNDKVCNNNNNNNVYFPQTDNKQKHRKLNSYIHPKLFTIADVERIYDITYH